MIEFVFLVIGLGVLGLSLYFFKKGFGSLTPLGCRKRARQKIKRRYDYNPR